MPNTAKLRESPFEGWTTMDEAAKIVERDHSTIRYWADNGKIACYRIGNSRVRVVNVDEVKEYSAQANRLEMPKRSKK